MSTTNFSREGTHTKTFHELLCSPSLMGGLQLESVSFSAVLILLSITTFLGNSLILVALHKESSPHPLSKLLYRCLAITDLLVGLISQPLATSHWMLVVHEHWSLCRYVNGAVYITGLALSGVSLMTTAAISMDRLLALLLGLRYRQIVTLKRTYFIVAAFWVFDLVASLRIIFDHRITLLYGYIIIPLCLVVSLASYRKIFPTLDIIRPDPDPFQQRPNQLNTLKMARYRKAVCSALWVQLALVVCHAPITTVEIVVAHSKTYTSHLIITRRVAVTLVYLNSTLNPFLYCWKISELRRAVKQTIRQALCCPWS